MWSQATPARIKPVRAPRHERMIASMNESHWFRTVPRGNPDLSPLCRQNRDVPPPCEFYQFAYAQSLNMILDRTSLYPDILVFHTQNGSFAAHLHARFHAISDEHSPAEGKYSADSTCFVFGLDAISIPAPQLRSAINVCTALHYALMSES